MPIYSPFQVLPVSSGWKYQLYIEGIYFKKVAVNAVRRTGPAISVLPEVIDPLLFKQGVLLYMASHRHIPGQPVHPGADGRIGVVNDEHQALGFGRHLINIERRVNIGPIAGEPGRNKPVGVEFRTAYMQRMNITECLSARFIGSGKFHGYTFDVVCGRFPGAGCL